MLKKHDTPGFNTSARRRMLKLSPSGTRVDELHRSPTRFERFRGWVEGLPKVRLYFALALISWASLTALIALGAQPPLERAIAQGLMEGATPAQLEQLNLPRSWNPSQALLGVALVVALEMGVIWYFLERFGSRILKTNAAIRVALAASLMIVFTALARFFIELDFNPCLAPLPALSIIGTVLLGPRLTLLMVIITSVNAGIMSANTFLTTALLLVSGFAIYTVAGVDSRQALLKAGLVIAVVMAAATSAVSLIGGGDFAGMLWLGVLGLGNGLLSLMLAMVLLPLLEDAFDILTPMKLLEISDPGTPLMMRLLETARQIASRLLTNVNVREAISDLSKLNIAGTSPKDTDLLTLENVDIAGGREKLRKVESQTDHTYQDAPASRVLSLREVEEWRRSQLAEIDAAIKGVQARKDELRRRNGLLVYQAADLRPPMSDKLQAEFDALNKEYQRLRQEWSRVEVEAALHR